MNTAPPRRLLYVFLRANVAGTPCEAAAGAPAMGASPLANGRWKATPGSCTVSEVISGRRFCGR